MSEIDERLRRMTALSAQWLDSAEGRASSAQRAHRARRLAVIDMSASSVDRRLREMSRVSALCVDLAGD